MSSTSTINYQKCTSIIPKDEESWKMYIERIFVIDLSRDLLYITDAIENTNTHT